MAAATLSLSMAPAWLTGQPRVGDTAHPSASARQTRAMEMAAMENPSAAQLTAMAATT